MSAPKYRVNLSGKDARNRPVDYAPRFGSGWRIVEVKRIGPKWVTLVQSVRHIDTGEVQFIRRARMPRDLWDSLPKTEVTA